MALTRFKDGRKNEDGPVSGALQCIPITFDDVAASETVSHRVVMPSGSRFRVTNVTAGADAITGDPQLSIGTTAAGTEIVNAVSLTTNLGAATVRAYTPAATGMIDVVLVADADDAAESAYINLWGYLIAPPTSVLQDDRGGQKGY
jgi:hypothetical protein